MPAVVFRGMTDTLADVGMSAALSRNGAVDRQQAERIGAPASATASAG